MSVKVERIDNEILVRIPSSMDIEVIQSLIDKISFFEILSRSKASDEEISDLAKMTKKNWSPKIKNKLSSMDEFKDLF